MVRNCQTLLTQRMRSSAAGFLVWALAICPIVLAQNAKYAEMPFPPSINSKETEKTARDAATDALKDNKGLTDAKKAAIRTWVSYYMAKMTRAAAGKPDVIRQDIYLQIFSTRVPEARTVAIEQAVIDAKTIVEGNYAPAVRINAMLIIADLDDPQGGKPFAKALVPLFTFVSNDKLPAHLRCLALYGFERHAKATASTWNPKQKETIAAPLIAILGSQPTVLTEVPAHWWLVRRSYDTLATMGSDLAFDQAVKHFSDASVLPSVRLSAGQYLTRFDLTAKLDEAARVKFFAAVAQLVDQEVIGWWEVEDDKVKMASNASAMGGGYGGGLGGEPGGGIGGGVGGGMMSGEGSGAPGYGSDGGSGSGFGSGSGIPGEGGYGMPGGGPKPNDTQRWDLRLARRKLNTFSQLGYVLLKGVTGAKEQKRYQAAAKITPEPKGVLEAPMPEEIQRTVSDFIEAYDIVQTTINDKKLVDIGSLMTLSRLPLDNLRGIAEEIPGFAELSPRMKSHKRADQQDKLGDGPQGQKKNPPPAEGEPGAAAPGAPAEGAGNPPGAQPAGAPAGGTPAPAGGTPAPAGGTPAPAGGTPAPAGGTPAPAGGAPGANPAGGQ